eukprot:gene13213-15748_t
MEMTNRLVQQWVRRVVETGMAHHVVSRLQVPERRQRQMVMMTMFWMPRPDSVKAIPRTAGSTWVMAIA